MKNIPDTHTLTQICGKPTCLPGKPWSPGGLDSLRFLSQCGQCAAEEEEEGSLGRTILVLSQKADPPLFSDVPLELLD